MIVLCILVHRLWYPCEIHISWNKIAFTHTAYIQTHTVYWVTTSTIKALERCKGHSLLQQLYDQDSAACRRHHIYQRKKTRLNHTTSVSYISARFLCTHFNVLVSLDHCFCFDEWDRGLYRKTVILWSCHSLQNTSGNIFIKHPKPWQVISQPWQVYSAEVEVPLV